MAPRQNNGARGFKGSFNDPKFSRTLKMINNAISMKRAISKERAISNERAEKNTPVGKKQKLYEEEKIDNKIIFPALEQLAFEESYDSRLYGDEVFEFYK